MPRRPPLCDGGGRSEPSNWSLACWCARGAPRSFAACSKRCVEASLSVGYVVQEGGRSQRHVSGEGSSRAEGVMCAREVPPQRGLAGEVPVIRQRRHSAGAGGQHFGGHRAFARRTSAPLARATRSFPDCPVDGLDSLTPRGGATAAASVPHSAVMAPQRARCLLHAVCFSGRRLDHAKSRGSWLGPGRRQRIGRPRRR